MTEPAAPAVVATRLADGEWHRLHPATPLLRGGIALVAILGIILVNLRDLWIEILIGGPDDEGDPFTFIIENGYVGLALLAIAGGLVLFIGGFYVSWRMHTFRITDELVEVRSGILFRTHRRGRLDRIQGINVVRPFLARLFGAAKLEINVAGQDANVPLAYLGSAAADELRREILALASGTQEAVRQQQGPAGGLLERRVNELLAPELAPDEAPPQSVVQMHLGRLLGSIALSAGPVFVAVIVGIVVATMLTGEVFFLLGFVPGLLGVGGYYVSRFTKSLRYSIASTRDGIRVGYGLLSTSNETLPPGRIHAIQVSQPLLWRPFGWWEVKINRASQSSVQGAAGQANTTILPVGSLGDVQRVVGLILPGLGESAVLTAGLLSRDDDDGFVVSPPRARVLRWFSRRRNGFAIGEGVVLLRRGAVWRELIVVPQARIQSVALRRGPLLRALRLAGLRIHTVAGPVSAHVGAIGVEDAVAGFEAIAAGAISAAVADTSHRWRASELAPPVLGDSPALGESPA